MKIVYFILGSVSLTCGIVGLILPVIPQIPFLICACFCFSKISTRFKKWADKHKDKLPFHKSKYAEPEPTA